eukprot:TRINITY_DN27089_c0_g1_i1.p1 TRINITY_DN27089_c0_g1~~TRINITY_DN27089_c0_g1_i1.p1  ORF type:complete len:884 (-),score=154.46 TRINITY_DN27089_c0_g1_i1:90-2741(-)
MEGPSRMPAPLATPSGSFRPPSTPKQGASEVSPSMIMQSSSRSFFSPGSDVGSSCSPGKRRPGTGRFNMEELSCFKRLPTPSALYPRKLEVYWQSTGGLRKVLSDSGLHTLPAMRGEFYRYRAEDYLPQEKSSADLLGAEPLAPERASPLPDEERTARVLDEIYPRRLFSREAENDKPERSKYSKARTRSFTNTSSQPEPPSPITEKSQGGSSGRSPPPAQRRLVQFRQNILDKFSTMNAAFEKFATDGTKETKELSKKEFSRFLTKHFGGLAREEHERIFEFLDHDKSGSLSLHEFHTAIEAAAPVKTLDDLRRKWIALGYPSMRQALLNMDMYKDPGRRFTLQEFGNLLSKVGIDEDTEHQSIFDAVADHGSKTNTVTLEMLASALSTVSPALLLEDVRDRILKKFGSLSMAFASLDIDQGDSLNIGEFIRFAVPAWKMTPFEAAKCFRLIDVDQSHNISKDEFLTALTLSEPNLYLDEIRRKIRQRFRSVRGIIGVNAAADEVGSPGTGSRAGSPMGKDRQPTPEAGGAFALQRRARNKAASAIISQMMDVLENDTVTNKQELAHTPADYQHMLAQAQMSEFDTKALFDLMDINRDGKLTATEFERGVRLFAPSVVLEDLRLSCVRQYSSVLQAFASIPSEKREVLMDVNQLQQLLKDVGVFDEKLDLAHIVDIIEFHRDGGVTVSELIAALQAGQPGTQVRLLPEQRDLRAKQQVKWQMAPFHRSAEQLRMAVRERPDDDEEKWPGGQRSQSRERRKGKRAESLPTTVQPAAGVVMEDPVWGASKLKKDEVSNDANSSSDTKMQHERTRQSFTKVSRHLGVLQKEESGPIVDKLQGYYTTAGESMNRHEPLMTHSHSRFTQFQSSNLHYACLLRAPGCP